MTAIAPARLHGDLLDSLDTTLTGSETATVARGLAADADRDSRYDALVTLAQAEEDLIDDGLRDVLHRTIALLAPGIEPHRRERLWSELAEAEALLRIWQGPDAGGLFDAPPAGCSTEATVRAAVDTLVDRRESALTLLLGGTRAVTP